MKQLDGRRQRSRWAAVGHWFSRAEARRLRRRHAAPRLEQLEDRTVPAPIVNEVKVIHPLGNSQPQNLTDVHGTLFFSADDGTHGTELWKSDGTDAGTVLVKDINPGSGGSNSTNLTAVGNTLFFTANDGTDGVELWKSDGTEAGTVLVKKFNPGPNGSNPTGLTAVGNALFFAADDGTHGAELWKSDGTATGTVLIKDINPGSGGSSPANLTAVGSTLFFGDNDGTHGNQLWKSDGTADGTVRVKDFNAAAGGAIDLHNFLAVANTLYFSSLDYYYGNEVWKSDGTTAGTVPVTRGVIPAETVETQINDLTAVGNTVYFFYLHGHINVDDLWKTDGTAVGTVRVKQFNNSSPASLTAAGYTLFFSYAGAEGNGLWKSDGTAAGTVLVKAISNPAGFPPPHNFASLNGRLVFAADDGTHGTELWTSDGTADGTLLAKDIFPGSGSSNPGPPTVSGGRTFFAANDTAGSRQLWSLQAPVPAKVGVVRAAAGGGATLSLDSNGNGMFDGGDSVFTFGRATDTFLAGDWAGLGYDSVGVVRPTASGVAQFSLDSNGDYAFDSGDQVFSFGLNGDTFLAGDWNGSGTTKIGVVRPGADGVPVFSLDTNGDGVFDAGDTVTKFGLNGDTFLVGDWNGDGRSKIGVVRPGPNGVAIFSLDTNGDGVFDAGDQVFSFGLNTDTFLVGDWNSDGRSKIGVVRPGANGLAVFSLDFNGNGTFDAEAQVFSFGMNGDKFLVGRWKPSGSLLVAADGALDAPVQPLTTGANFAAAVNQAIDLWARAGLDGAHLAQLRAAHYGVAALGGAALGADSGDSITIDAGAAGHG